MYNIDVILLDNRSNTDLGENFAELTKLSPDPRDVSCQSKADDTTDTRSVNLFFFGLHCYLHYLTSIVNQLLL